MAEEKNVQVQDLNQLRKVRREKLAELQANGKDPFVITKFDQTHHSMEIKDNFDEMEGKTVTIAGRMMSKRVMGKASFCGIQDLQGKISNESPVGKALLGAKVGDVVDVETQAGVIQYKVLEIQRAN